MFRRLTAAAGVLAGGGVVGVSVWWLRQDRLLEAARVQRTALCATDVSPLNVRPTAPLPTRAEILLGLQADEQLDVLVIGGGATGAGVAVDAQTRGLKTALIERDDFSCGTSSRSTKLIHGGVRYLQSAIMKLDVEQYRMVKEALFERANLLEIAPHLSNPLPIMLPIYKWWQLPYFWFGIKMYDLVAGRRCIKKSYYISKRKALELFPMLRKDKLVGALIYYDGQHNDARMNLAIVLTAIRNGALCANHVQALSLIKDATGKLCGARLRDELTGREWNVRARAVVNATGPFTDSIRQMANPSVRPICIPSQGVHIVLPGYYSPSSTGLLDPSTSDGRVIFFLPWERMTVAGTTDSACDLTFSPAPAEKDIEFILNEIRHYLSSEISVRRGDVMSAWAGLRPLVRDPSKADTASLARNHVIEVDESNLVTIAGGKWTTYRQMAQDTVDAAIKSCGLSPTNGCVTAGLLLEGAHDWHELLYINLVQDYGLEVEVAQNLANTYGDRAFSVAKLSRLTGKRWPIVGTRLHEEFPYLEAEVQYAVREYACSAIDVLSRRLRLAFLNTHAALEALPVVVRILAHELGWSKAESEKQLAEAKRFIEVEMGQQARVQAIRDAPLHMTKEEVQKAKQRFEMLDKTRKGHVTLNDLRRYFREKNEKIDERLLHDLLNEVDLNKNGEIELMEFLALYSGLKSGQVSQSRLARYLDADVDDYRKIPVNRSGGGL